MKKIDKILFIIPLALCYLIVLLSFLYLIYQFYFIVFPFNALFVIAILLVFIITSYFIYTGIKEIIILG